jgi:hypothetical protein
VAALLTSLLLPVASASASAYTAVLNAYASSPTQTIPPCKFSASVLAQARSSVPNDNQQYDQSLIVAIEQAQQQRAGGACRAKKHRTGEAATPVGTPAPPAAPRLGRSTPLPLGSPTAATDSGLPAPIAILAVVAGVFLIGAVALGAARLGGWDPEWLIRSRHSWSEAGYRVSGIWSKVGDRLRNRLEIARPSRTPEAKKGRMR